MELEEKEQTETILKKLIEKVEKDDLPTNVFDIENTDPLVLLGKMNEIIKNLKLFASWVSQSDEKAGEALTKALDALIKSGEALTEATQASTLAEASNTKATEAENKAENALNKAEIADSTAIEAVNDATEALSKANEALEAVVEGQGTKVFDNHGKLLANAHFTGHNGINVDMSENDPETFDIRLDETITKAIEDNHIQGQSNKQRLDENDADIINLTEMLSHTEELAQKASEDIENTINPKLAELETSKVSKTFTNQFGDTFTLDYEKYAQNLDITWKTLSATWRVNVNLYGYTFLYNNIEIFKIDLSNASYRGTPLALNYEWKSVNIASTAKSAGDHTIDLATAWSDWQDNAEYEAVVCIEAYKSDVSYMQTSTDMFENSQSDQRFSTNGRQGGGIYTLPLKRYLKWHINSSLNTLYINIRAIRRTK